MDKYLEQSVLFRFPIFQVKFKFLCYIIIRNWSNGRVWFTYFNGISCQPLKRRQLRLSYCNFFCNSAAFLQNKKSGFIFSQMVSKDRLFLTLRCFQILQVWVWEHLYLTAKIGGSRLRSMGFMMMKTCWFLCVRPLSSLRAALQKNCTQPCLPKNVDGRPRGRPNLNGKLWMPADNRTGSPPIRKATWVRVTNHFRIMIFFQAYCYAWQKNLPKNWRFAKKKSAHQMAQCLEWVALWNVQKWTLKATRFCLFLQNLNYGND